MGCSASLPQKQEEDDHWIGIWEYHAKGKAHRFEIKTSPGGLFYKEKINHQSIIAPVKPKGGGDYIVEAKKFGFEILLNSFLNCANFRKTGKANEPWGKNINLFKYNARKRGKKKAVSFGKPSYSEVAPRSNSASASSMTVTVTDYSNDI